MAKQTISFSTFNLYNLQLPGKPLYKKTKPWTENQYKKKLEWAFKKISLLNSDVWGFQELWVRKGLEDVFEFGGLKDQYELLIPDSHSGKKIICAGAVRKGMLLGKPEWIEDFPDKFKLRSKGDDSQTSSISVNIKKFSRPVLKFRIKPYDDVKPITVFVAHLKSKSPTQIYFEKWYKNDDAFYKKHYKGIGAALSTIRRTAEATALRMILTEEMKGSDKPIVLMGDLNDSQLSNTLNIISDQPNYLLSMSRGGTDTGLYTVGTLQEYRSLRDVYYTHKFKNIKESLDHIMVSQEFYDNSRKRIWAFEGMVIYNDHLNNENHKQNGSTDHGIVSAEFIHSPAISK